MSKRALFILIAFVIAGAGFWLFLEYRTPPGIEPKGTDSEVIAWIGLASSIIGLLSGLVALIKSVVDLRAASK